MPVEFISDFSDLASGDEVTIDAKGRIPIKPELRGEVGGLVLTPKAGWDRLVERVRQFDEFDPARQAFDRMVIGGSEAAGFDNQGRLAIPRAMRKFASLEIGKAKIVGMTNRVEVWSVNEYDKYQLDPEGYNKARREAIERAYRQMTAKP
jgi:MraZ protein